MKIIRRNESNGKPDEIELLVDFIVLSELINDLPALKKVTMIIEKVKRLYDYVRELEVRLANLPSREEIKEEGERLVEEEI